MLCVIEDVKRILETQKDNITIGDTDDDTMKENDVLESIRAANSIINGTLRGTYELPFTKRILLKEKCLVILPSRCMPSLLMRSVLVLSLSHRVTWYPPS